MWVFILFRFKYINNIPFDFALENGKYKIAKFFTNLIQNWFSESDSENSHFHCNADADNINQASFHRNTTKHHILNHDLFDEEDDSWNRCVCQFIALPFYKESFS